MHLIPTAMPCDSLCEVLPPGEAPEKLGPRVSIMEPVTGSPDWHTPKLQTARRTAGVHRKRCLDTQLRRREPLLPVFRRVGTLPKSKFPGASRGQTLRTGLSEDSGLRPLCQPSVDLSAIDCRAQCPKPKAALNSRA